MRQTHGKKVLMYDKNYNFIREFNSIAEAAEISGISRSCIKQSCSKIKTLYLVNYIFRYKGEEIDEGFIKRLENKKKERYTLKNKKIVMLNDKNQILKIFQDAKEAGKFVNRARRTIMDACHKKGRICAGYFWEYLK